LNKHSIIIIQHCDRRMSSPLNFFFRGQKHRRLPDYWKIPVHRGNLFRTSYSTAFTVVEIKSQRRHDTAHVLNRQLVEEVPVAITINGISFVVMLASPYDLDDFAYGLLLSEGVINHKNQIHDVRISPASRGMQVDVSLANRRLNVFNTRQRQLRGTSGCGLCGKAAIDDAFPALKPLSKRSCPELTNIAALKEQLPLWQTRAKLSGAMHAAFWVDEKAQILACREDIGRHNAVDKLIGYALKENWQPDEASLLVTSRCSVEIVQKAIRFGFANLITLASPTQLAVDIADEHNLNLVHIPKAEQPYLLTGKP